MSPSARYIASLAEYLISTFAHITNQHYFFGKTVFMPEPWLAGCNLDGLLPPRRATWNGSKINVAVNISDSTEVEWNRAYYGSQPQYGLRTRLHHWHELLYLIKTCNIIRSKLFLVTNCLKLTFIITLATMWLPSRNEYMLNNSDQWITQIC